eukprot:CAMPEP_0179446186 /NCGR_PEP_ID=MMETSP0799-20121207/29596_1 /TAXON_ID=46947 /ORGANISM="Geminigera cryophila, Strain CCMP2564" /LENGTH=69 /DNA_ID=CAMNT_0021234905 /DNA_START=14 /DNA_END=223 /DNA_ORIENTATION=+
MFQDIRSITTLYNQITPTVSKFWEGPVEMSTYVDSQVEAYSCVAGDVACNAAPATASAADSWSGTINNP